MRLIFKNVERETDDPARIRKLKAEGYEEMGPCTAGRKRRADGSAGRNECFRAACAGKKERAGWNLWTE